MVVLYLLLADGSRICNCFTVVFVIGVSVHYYVHCYFILLDIIYALVHESVGGSLHKTCMNVGIAPFVLYSVWVQIKVSSGRVVKIKWREAFHIKFIHMLLRLFKCIFLVNQDVRLSLLRKRNFCLLELLLTLQHYKYFVCIEISKHLVEAPCIIFSEFIEYKTIVISYENKYMTLCIQGIFYQGLFLYWNKGRGRCKWCYYHFTHKHHFIRWWLTLNWYQVR